MKLKRAEENYDSWRCRSLPLPCKQVLIIKLLMLSMKSENMMLFNNFKNVINYMLTQSNYATPLECFNLFNFWVTGMKLAYDALNTKNWLYL